jgi:hypothetical protein
MQFQKGQSGSDCVAGLLKGRHLAEERLVFSCGGEPIQAQSQGTDIAGHAELDDLVDELLRVLLQHLLIAGVASAAAAGDVTADEAAKLAKVISLYVNTLEAHNFEDRLARLERADLKRVRDMSHASNDAPINNRA